MACSSTNELKADAGRRYESLEFHLDAAVPARHARAEDRLDQGRVWNRARVTVAARAGNCLGRDRE